MLKMLLISQASLIISVADNWPVGQQYFVARHNSSLKKGIGSWLCAGSWKCPYPDFFRMCMDHLQTSAQMLLRSSSIDRMIIEIPVVFIASDITLMTSQPSKMVTDMCKLRLEQASRVCRGAQLKPTSGNRTDCKRGIRLYNESKWIECINWLNEVVDYENINNVNTCRSMETILFFFLRACWAWFPEQRGNKKGLVSGLDHTTDVRFLQCKACMRLSLDENPQHNPSGIFRCCQY